MSKQQFYLLGAAVVVVGIVTMSGIFSSSSETAEWVEEAKLFPKDGIFHEGFGTAVAMDGNTLKRLDLDTESRVDEVGSIPYDLLL